MFKKIPYIENNKFITYDEKPVFAIDYRENNDQLKTPQVLTIIMQGPIISENNFTVETIKIYKRTFPDCPIIVSTWKTEPEDAILAIREQGVTVLLNDEPPIKGWKNVNKQIFSTFNAIKMAKENGAKYVIKTRTDQRMYETNIPEYLFNLLKIFPPYNPNVQNSRIVTMSLNTFKYRINGITDMFMFGDVDDILKYWSCELDKRENFEYKTLYDFMTCKISELYFTTEYLKKINVPVEMTINSAWENYARYFCVIDAASIGMFWPKYSNEFNRWRNFTGETPMLEELSFKEWFNLYAGLENKIPISNKMLEEADPNQIIKPVLTRIACLGQFTLENLFMPNAQFINFQKNRVDYALKISENPNLSIKIDEVSKFIPDKGSPRFDYIKNMFEQETKDIFSYKKANMLILDSFAELTDKLFVNKFDNTEFLAHWRDIEHTEEFNNSYEYKGTIIEDKIEEYYDKFFEKFNKVYGNVPIIFILFPTTLDKREEYINRAIIIEKAINNLTKKYENLFVVKPTLVEANENDASVYHFSAKTYREIAKQIAALKIGFYLKNSTNKDGEPKIKTTLLKIKLFLCNFIPIRSIRRKTREKIRNGKF